MFIVVKSRHLKRNYSILKFSSLSLRKSSVYIKILKSVYNLLCTCNHLACVQPPHPLEKIGEGAKKSGRERKNRGGGSSLPDFFEGVGRLYTG